MAVCKFLSRPPQVSPSPLRSTPLTLLTLSMPVSHPTPCFRWQTANNLRTAALFPSRSPFRCLIFAGKQLEDDRTFGLQHPEGVNSSSRSSSRSSTFVAPSNPTLYFAGKQLEDGCTFGLQHPEGVNSSSRSPSRSSTFVAPSNPMLYFAGKQLKDGRTLVGL
jgi:hypothetical protein